MLVENLEQRCLFTITVTGGVLQLNSYASGNANAFELVLNGSTIQLRNANTLAVIDSVANSASITGAKIDMLGGNDLFRVGRPDGTLMPTNISVTVTGNTGDDSLTGGVKNDSIFGDVGNDLMDGRAGGDIIDGGTGFDTADYSSRANQVKVTLEDNTANDGTNAGNNSTPAQYNDNASDNVKNTEAVLGGSGNDSLSGSAAGTVAQWFDGGAGNDSIFAGGGTDTINGGVGADLAYGQDGDDYFFIQDNTGDKFLGGSGTTFAQYDITTDLAAPALPVNPAAATAAFVPVTTSLGLVPMLLGPAAVSPPPISPNSTPISTDDDLSPDADFGTEGKTITEVDGQFIQINDMKVQQTFDGDQLVEKFVAVGVIQGDSDDDFIVIRYNNDGSLDTTFGENETGIVTTDFTNEYNEVEDDDTTTDDSAASLLIDSNGNIVVLGTVTPDDSNSVFGVVRYDADGIIDDSFGDAGFVLVERSGRNVTAARIATQQVFNGDTTEEEYVIAGTLEATEGGNADFLLNRLYETGDRDFGFGGGEGSVQVNYFNNNDFATGLAIDPNTQNIWVSGYTQNTHGTNFLIAGLDVDGAPIAGALTNYNFGADDFAYASAISGDKLIVVGSTGFGESVIGAILAVNISEDSFYAPGEVTNNYYLSSGNGPVSLNGVTTDTDGNLVAVGSVNFEDFFVHRFDYNLNPIGTDTIVDFGDSTDVASAVGIQDDGKIVVAGTSDGAAAITRLTDFHLVDVEINALTFAFTYTDETGTHTLPTYLTSKLTSLGLGGVVELSGTPGDDKFTAVVTGDPTVTITITDINGIHVYDYDSSLVTKVILHGLDGNDSILADPLFNIPTFLDGGKGNDSIRGGIANDSIRGGDGNDSIDAGGGDDAAFGDNGNDSIKGGDGNDLVLGGGGNDCLQGNNGRDILIGGGDTDRADGGAGDDILTGGSTNYDGNDAALAALMQEWVRTDANYATRVSHITNGGGFNVVGSTAIKLNANTVHSSGFLPDSLTGGSDNDLFFVASFGDKILDFDKNRDTKFLVHA